MFRNLLELFGPEKYVAAGLVILLFMTAGYALWQRERVQALQADVWRLENQLATERATGSILEEGKRIDDEVNDRPLGDLPDRFLRPE